MKIFVTWVNKHTLFQVIQLEMEKIVIYVTKHIIYVTKHITNETKVLCCASRHSCTCRQGTQFSSMPSREATLPSWGRCSTDTLMWMWRELWVVYPALVALFMTGNPEHKSYICSYLACTGVSYIFTYIWWARHFIEFSYRWIVCL